MNLCRIGFSERQDARVAQVSQPIALPAQPGQEENIETG